MTVVERPSITVEMPPGVTPRYIAVHWHVTDEMFDRLLTVFSDWLPARTHEGTTTGTFRSVTRRLGAYSVTMYDGAYAGGVEVAVSA